MSITQSNQTENNSVVKNKDTEESSESEIELKKNEIIELFTNSVFDLKEIFKLSIKFLKENENKAFHPSYDVRNYFYALNFQIKYGAFKEEKASQLGALDFVGKDRRLAWKELGDLSKDDAMKQFINELNQICPAFKLYIEAHIKEKQEKERILKEEELKKIKEEEEEKNKKEEENRKREESEKIEKQRKEFKEALKKQTFHQFLSYAQQQYPYDSEAQKELIKQLEEQHYQQFIEQIMQSQFDKNNLKKQQKNQDELIQDMNGLTLENNDPQITNGLNSSDEISNTNRKIDNSSNFSSSYNLNDCNEYENEEVEDDECDNEEEDDDEDDDDDVEENEEDDDDNYNDNSDNNSSYDGSQIKVSQAQIWTKKIIKPFKESISLDSADGIIKVGHGETVTIKVPTHSSGKSIVWEFATDSYDIGFGLFFEFNDDPGDQVTIQVYESEDDDDEDDDDSDLDPEKGSFSTKSKLPKNIIPIIPIYRRDCHEEVFAGSHDYPGKGVYLLKFDNSYSIWRAKTLYYRVYYTSQL